MPTISKSLVVASEGSVDFNKFIISKCSKCNLLVSMKRCVLCVFWSSIRFSLYLVGGLVFI